MTFIAGTAAATTPNVAVTSSAALTPYATPSNYRFPQQVVRTLTTPQSDTLPVISTLTAPNGKTTYIVTNEGTAVLTINAGTGNTILGQASITLNPTDSYTLWNDTATDWAAE